AGVPRGAGAAAAEGRIVHRRSARTGLRLVALVAALAAVSITGGPGAGSDEPKDKAVELKVGDPAPPFVLSDDQGKPWKSADHFGKKWVVIYFYPGDFTPGCTIQAKAFKEGMTKLAEEGVEVVGISGDS